MKWLAVVVPIVSVAALLYLLSRWRAPFEDVTPPYSKFFPPKPPPKPFGRVWDGDRWVRLSDDE